MRALVLAVTLSVLLLSGIILWALGTGTSMSGEPSAMLVVQQGEAKPVAGDNSVSPVPGESKTIREGAQEVTLDVGRFGTRMEDDTLIEQTAEGPVPKRARDGRTAASAYAKVRIRESDATPSVAIVVRGLGLDRRMSMGAIERLPAEISLAFSPYSEDLVSLAAMAHKQGHESILQIPLEPEDYPDNDTGPKTLLAAAADDDNRPRLFWAMSRYSGYFAVMNASGGNFLANMDAVGRLFRELKERGVHFFSDTRTGAENLSKQAGEIQLGFASADIEIDRDPDPRSITMSLRKLEELAKRSGYAVGVASMHQVTIDQLDMWSRRLADKGMKLVPVSTSYVRQKQEM